jgi:hypothetical protein
MFVCVTTVQESKGNPNTIPMAGDFLGTIDLRGEGEETGADEEDYGA